jgi:hypothetical protein
MTTLRVARQLSLVFVLLISSAFVLRADDGRVTAISREGEALARTLDSLDVEHLWIKGKEVDWKTGKTVSDKLSYTHCSVFVAAACDRLNVYILRPPEHAEYLLANAQQDWLTSDEAKASGWERVASAWDAQILANRGRLVVASYKNSNEVRPGHIAVIRPSTKSKEAVEQEGPDIIQAGAKNYRKTSVKEGFRYHKDVWRKGEVFFFAHDVAFASPAISLPFRRSYGIPGLRFRESSPILESEMLKGAS